MYDSRTTKRVRFDDIALGKGLARDHNRKNRRENRPILSAKAIDPARAGVFTGETVGNSSHGGGPTTHARVSRKSKRVSTLTEHRVHGKGGTGPVESEKARIKRIARETGRSVHDIQG